MIRKRVYLTHEVRNDSGERMKSLILLQGIFRGRIVLHLQITWTKTVTGNQDLSFVRNLKTCWMIRLQNKQFRIAVPE